MFTVDFNRILQGQQAVIQRNVASVDAYGGDAIPDWQYHLTTPCILWWDRSSGARSSNRMYVTPARTVPVSEGGMLVPLGTDVTEDDQIVRLEAYDQESGEYQSWIEGTFQIVAAVTQPSHIELSILRIVLGG